MAFNRCNYSSEIYGEKICTVSYRRCNLEIYQYYAAAKCISYLATFYRNGAHELVVVFFFIIITYIQKLQHLVCFVLIINNPLWIWVRVSCFIITYTSNVRRRSKYKYFSMFILKLQIYLKIRNSKQHYKHIHSKNWHHNSFLDD